MMGRTGRLALFAVSAAVCLLLFPGALGQTSAAAGDRPLFLRFRYESGHLYIDDAFMGLVRIGPGGYLHLGRHCWPPELTECPFTL